MFAFFNGASLKFAKNLIQVTGLKESLALFRKHNFSNVGDADVLKLLLAVDACNLIQTMKEVVIAKEISEEDRQDTVEDYIVENLKVQTLIACRDGAERMDQCGEILMLANKFGEYWNQEETKDPGPRFYCVKELLKRLGCEANTPIHDNLFEFVYKQHNQFDLYFRTLLEPFDPGEYDVEETEPIPLAVVLRSPEPEPESDDAGSQASSYAEGTEDKLVEMSRPSEEEEPSETAGETFSMSEPLPPIPAEPESSLEDLKSSVGKPAPLEEEEPDEAPPPGMTQAVDLETGEVTERESLPPMDQAAAKAGPGAKLEDSELSMEDASRPFSAKPSPQMLEDLFKKVNPIEPNQT